MDICNSNSNINLLIFRLIKEGICDKTTVPSVSAISRLLRGRDEDEVKKSSMYPVLNFFINPISTVYY